MTDRDEVKLLERLRSLFAGGNGETDRSAPSLPPGPGDGSSECEEARELSCRQAAERVYEFLDGELDPEWHEAVRCHVEQCSRCYPMFDWEEMFLDAIRESADRPERNPGLHRKLEALLEREGDE